MNTQGKIVILSFLFGVVIWVVDALLDYLAFYTGSFWGLLIYEIPPHELYIRSLILILFIVFGIIVSAFINRLKRTEQLLASETELLAVTLSSTSDGVISTDIQGKIASLNRTAEELTGWTEAEALGRSLEEVFHIVNEKTRERCENPVEKVLRTRLVVGLANDTMLIGRDGTERILADSGTPIFSKDRTIYGVVLVFRDITERRIAEQTLEIERHRFKLLAEQSPFGLVMIAEDGTFEYVNPKFTEIFGYSLGDVVNGKEWLRKAYPDPAYRREVASAWVGDLSRHKPGEQPSRVFSVRCKDGTEKIVHFRPVQLETGDYFMTCEDITDRTQAEKAIRESQEKFSKAFQFAPVPMAIASVEEGRFVEVNDAFVQTFEYERSEVLGKTAVELGIWRDEEERAAWVKTLKEQGFVRNLEVAFSTKRDRRYGLFSSVALQISGEPCLLSSMNDITDRKNAEQALQLSEERYRTLFDQSIDAILIVHPEGKIINANRACSKLLGAPVEEIVGSYVMDFYTNPSDWKEFRRTIDKNGFVRDFEWHVRCRDGSLRHCVSNSSEWKDRHGKTLAYLGIVRDITESKRLEEQLVQSQKMEAVGTLAGGIAHDFNNLLQVIQGYADIALLDIKHGQPGHSELREIRNAGRNAAELTHGLLTFSRRVESKMRPVNINKELQHVAKLLARTLPKMIEIEMKLAEETRTIRADPAQLQQVVMNLAVNARDAMPDGGKLVIETHDIFLDEEYCRTHLGTKSGNYALLGLSDNGVGMDSKTIRHIFDPFFTTKEAGRGTGLGLAIVYGIVKHHGGNIICYSEPGQGTTFKIYLPAMETGEEADHSQQTREITGGSETILLVDDEESVRNLGEKMLNKFGYTVLTASNGREGLEIFRKDRARISLVILDLVMPEMTGRECLKEILRIDPPAKVLVASGYASNGLIERAVEEGAKASIRKPYETRPLLELIRRVLEE